MKTLALTLWITHGCFCQAVLVSSYVTSFDGEEITTKIDSCAMVSEFPSYDRDKLTIVYKNYTYVYKFWHFIGDIEYNQYKTDYYYAKWLGADYHIRIASHDRISYKSIWVTPIHFRGQSLYLKRGFCFSNDPGIVKNFTNCKKQ